MADRAGFVAGASAPVISAPAVNDASVFGRVIAIDPSPSLPGQIPAPTAYFFFSSSAFSSLRLRPRTRGRNGQFTIHLFAAD